MPKTNPIVMPLEFPGLNDLQKLEKRMKALEREVTRLTAKLPQASNNVRKFGRASKTAASGGKALSAAFAKVAVVIGAVTAAVGSFNVAVSRTESERRIAILASSYGEAGELAAIASRAAAKFGNSQTEVNNALATTYARLRPVGVELDDIESVYGGFNTAARLAGASATESAGAFRQLAQALGSGALRGDEFNSIAEQAPLLLQAIATETNKDIGALRDFAATGGITSDIVIKALKRIETEGAGKLAESLKGPQQAIKNFQNAFENVGASLGKLAEPQLIKFFNDLTAILKAVESKMYQIGKVFEATANLLTAPFIALAEGIQSTMPQFDNFDKTVLQVIGSVVKVINDAVNNIIVPIFNVLGKVLGLAITWFIKFAQGVASAMNGAVNVVVSGIQAMATAISAFINATPIGVLTKLFGADLGAMTTAPLNDLAAGIDGVRNSVKGYIDEVGMAGRDFAIDRVDPTVYSGKRPSAGGSSASSKASGGGGAAGKAAADAEKLAQQTADRLLSAEKLVTAAQREGELLRANSDAEKAQIESMNAMMEIAEKYGELAAKSLSEEETKLLLQSQGLEIENERYALEEKLADIRKSGIGVIEDEIAHMEAILAGTEKEYLLRKKIAELGGGPEAEAKVQRLEQLKEEVAAFEEMEAKVDAVANSIAGSMTDAFTSVIDGSKSAEEAMADMMKDIAKSFIDMAADIIKQQIAMIIKGMIMKALGITMPGAGGGGAPTPPMPKFGPGFEGGGYTGSAPRSGGVDGKGGFPAILHPQETVIDHTKAMSNYSGGNALGGGAMAPMAANVTYSGPTLNFNGDDYIPRSEASALVAAGAKQGQARTMSSLKNSRSQRSKLGM